MGECWNPHSQSIGRFLLPLDRNVYKKKKKEKYFTSFTQNSVKWWQQWGIYLLWDLESVSPAFYLFLRHFSRNLFFLHNFSKSFLDLKMTGKKKSTLMQRFPLKSSISMYLYCISPIFNIWQRWGILPWFILPSHQFKP